MAKKKPVAPPKQVLVALLDADGIYQGMEEIAETAITPQHVLLPDGCDLPTGEYWWSVTLQAFMPIHTKGAE